MHQIQPTEGCELPKKSVPLASPDDIEREIPQLCKSAVEDVLNSQFHASSKSKFGHELRSIAQQLLAIDLTIFHTLLLAHFTVIFSSTGDILRLLQQVYQLRVNDAFINKACQILSEFMPSVSKDLIRRFVQRLIGNLITRFFMRQNKLLEQEVQINAKELSTNDRQVLFHICGYIIHKLRKRYRKSRSKGIHHLHELVANLQQQGENNSNVPSGWTEILDRGGLKKPNYNFFLLITQVERWLRGIADIDNLNANSLINLKGKLMEYNLLKLSWGKLMPENDNKWIVLEHVLSLFLKIRGFAITRLVRKQMQLKRKNTKIAAGTKKALRPSLKLMAK